MKNIIVVLGMLMVGFGFYWTQVRPSQIKHDCSWKKVVVPYQPAKPPMTDEELVKQGITINCTDEGSSMEDLFCKSRLEMFRKGSPEIPASENWKKTNDVEYKFCLRDKGL